MSQHLPQEITASPIFSLLISTTNIPHDTTLIYIYIYYIDIHLMILRFDGFA